MVKEALAGLLLTAATFLLCHDLHSQGAGVPPTRPVLQALDTDHDGTLSATEIAQAPQALRMLDRNKDGQLTSDELQPRPQKAGATGEELVTQMMSFDRNGDGILTPEELPARMQSMFQRGDTDHDGRLTPEEIRALAARQVMPLGTRVEPGHVSGIMRLDPLLNALDANHDGVLSAEEIAGASQALRSLDLNSDGQITAEEMRVRQQTPAERAAHMLEEWDTNKDGKISKEEAPDRIRQQFSAIDWNGDGFLDRDELIQFFSVVAPAPQPETLKPGAAQPGSGGPKEKTQ